MDYADDEVSGGTPLIAAYKGKQSAPKIIMAVVIVLSLLLIIVGIIVLAAAKNIQWGLPLLFTGIAMGLSFGAGYIAKSIDKTTLPGEGLMAQYMPF